MKLILTACIVALLSIFIAPVGNAGWDQTPGDVIGCPDNGYKVEQRRDNIKVSIKYARVDFPIKYRFDGVREFPRYGDVTFTDPEGNQDYVCKWAYFRVENSGNWLRIVEFWEGEFASSGRYRVR